MAPVDTKGLDSFFEAVKINQRFIRIDKSVEISV